MVERRVVFRALGQSGEQGGFGEGEVVDVFGEVELAGGFESVGAVAQIDLVRVHGEDLVLGEDTLDLHGEQNFLELAAVGLLIGEEEIARQLHGERGGALGAAA